VDLFRFGREVRALRRRRRWRQVDLGVAAGVSQSEISRIELGQCRATSIDTIRRVAAALDAQVTLRLHWHGEGLDRLLDAAHAGLVERVVQLLRQAGWDVATEVAFSIYGERGSVDVMARHVARRLLLIVEVKAAIGDVQATHATFDRKVRHAHAIARERGWAPWPVARVLVVADDSTSRRRIAEHEATFRSRWPAGSREIRRWISATSTEPVAGVLFLPPARRAGTRTQLRRRLAVRGVADPSGG
jgi:transcriptional regulator with XRE-family HTH domain